MADAFLEMQSNSTAADLAREDWLGLLLDREATARDNKRLARRLSHARLRQSAVVEDTDFRAPRGLDGAAVRGLPGRHHAVLMDRYDRSYAVIRIGADDIGKGLRFRRGAPETELAQQATIGIRPSQIHS